MGGEEVAVAKFSENLGQLARELLAPLASVPRCASFPSPAARKP